MMRRYLYILVAILLISSCNHYDLCFHHPHTARARINVDWSKFDKEVPTGMTVMVYPDTGGKPYTLLTNNINYVLADLEAGTYNTLVYNQSTSEYASVLFTGMESYHTATVAAKEYKSRWYSSRSELEKIAMQPEWVGVDAKTGAVVTPEMVRITGEENFASITQKGEAKTEFVIASHIAHNIIHTVNVKVHLNAVYNLRSARASLTGMAAEYKFSIDETTEDKVTHLQESWTLVRDKVDPTRGYITAKFKCLGLPINHTSQPDDNEFVLSLLLVDDTTVMDFPFKVGSKLQKVYNEKGEYVLELNLELWIEEPLPDVKPSDSGESGFNATVDDWGEEEKVEIEI